MNATSAWHDSSTDERVRVVTHDIRLPILVRKAMQAYAARFYRLHLSTWGASLQVHARRADDKYVCEAVLATASGARTVSVIDWDIRKGLVAALTQLRSSLDGSSRGAGSRHAPGGTEQYAGE